MTRPDWVAGGDRRQIAAERIHRAATELVLADGFDGLDIETLARRLHCSRATVYWYAGGKAQIRDAVLMNLAGGVVADVRDAVDGLSGPERVITAIEVALDRIRSDPMSRLMHSAATAPGLGDLHSSPVLARLAADLTGITDDDPQAAQWVVRVVVSLAFWPTGDRRTEEMLLRRFVAPAFSSRS
ncbi:transcriptional regulator [Mycobacterium sp. 852013-51886_SCH5428379]|uniref:TetR/AcrR family transcriptional regulator n=1 Tax=Mycobacterium sp. 852013-51886_SCH5428379 TaxID=1834111 RepID=UPI0007FFB1D8|nr:TetR/AcrR family transcriptional regulator [Mycobacterium sp. 852013-51886_SCH5428379]OBB56689.1 transcriptional regulator [Mycobacterium sp. 852013-51886_SCH5428379]